MKNRTMFWLTATPCVIAVTFYFLNSILFISSKDYPIGKFGNTSSHWTYIYPIGISGLFLMLIVVPLLFRSGAVRWKNNNSSWWFPLLLALVAGIFGTVMNVVSFGYFMFITIPLGWIVFVISFLLFLVVARRTSVKAAVFLYFMLFVLPIIIAYFLPYMFWNFT